MLVLECWSFLSMALVKFMTRARLMYKVEMSILNRSTTIQSDFSAVRHAKKKQHYFVYFTCKLFNRDLQVSTDLEPVNHLQKLFSIVDGFEEQLTYTKWKFPECFLLEDFTFEPLRSVCSLCQKDHSEQPR
ncbi:hypothetical protein TNIN_456991 [Trichonephila inaurata madagascariensis]|uniref:Uncharacterized protein n=1 Tax=Trichonephila inaurata madagascariensis TaxID=2747483 RepID=A0A8X6X323_9ARAC|nr:hypothetical protein TNIN_456991 [Trichonephila inaurata madagascariensis]